MPPCKRWPPISSEAELGGLGALCQRIFQAGCWELPHTDHGLQPWLETLIITQRLRDWAIDLINTLSTSAALSSGFGKHLLQPCPAGSRETIRRARSEVREQRGTKAEHLLKGS